jgi:hypothetical protein
LIPSAGGRTPLAWHAACADRDLLDLQAFESIPIVTPAEALRRIEVLK